MNQIEIYNQLNSILSKNTKSIVLIKSKPNIGKTFLAKKILESIKDNYLYHSGAHPSIRNLEMKYLSELIQRLRRPLILVLDESYSHFFINQKIKDNLSHLIIFTNNQNLTLKLDNYQYYEFSMAGKAYNPNVKKSNSSMNTRIIGKYQNIYFEDRKCFGEGYSHELIIDTDSYQFSSKDLALLNKAIAIANQFLNIDKENNDLSKLN